ncbi:MAG: TIGR04076 family protein [Candidatus Bathyarchaeia archaeon]
MSSSYEFEVVVKSIKGKCFFGHKVGDKIHFNCRGIEGEICYDALLALLPYINAMRYGMDYPWAENKDIIPVACPDPENLVVFEIKRIKA